MKKPNKEPIPYEHVAFCILTPHGDVWGPEMFDSAGDAIKHLDRFWYSRGKWDDMGFTLAPATSTVAVTGPERVKLP